MQTTFIKDREIFSKTCIWQEWELFWNQYNKEKKGLDKISSGRDNRTKSAKIHCNIWVEKGHNQIFLKEYPDFITISDSELSMDVET